MHLKILNEGFNKYFEELQEKNKIDDIDAKRDDKVERAKKALSKADDDADALKDMRKKRAKAKFEKELDRADADRDDEKKAIKESTSSDLSEYQKWVDYDMKKYHRISDDTMRKIKKAGLSVVKDQYGDYEVIADRHIEEKCDKKMSKRNIKESVSDSPYKDIIAKYFDYTFDFDFLDVVSDIIDGVDFEEEDLDEEIYSAIDDGLIYDNDQWKIMMHYQTASEANFDNALEELTGDLIALCNEISESKLEESKRK